MTSCLGTSALFTCSTNQQIGLQWVINNIDPSFVRGALVVQSGTQSTLTVPTISVPQGAIVQCYYVQDNAPFLSFPANLFVQGLWYVSVTIPVPYIILYCLPAPPSAPTNFNITLNATSFKLAWAYSVQFPALSYIVLVTNSSGASVFSRTVMEPPVIITTPDPCDHYEATVTATYTSVVNCSENGTTITIVGGNHC